MSSSRPRRPSVSIYDYPEHLNPFNDDTTNSQTNHESKSSKELKHKFWTFGRSRKKRSNSFSIKSTWNGLFGKCKEPYEVVEKRSTITTVSTTYKREPYNKPIAPPRSSKDQQEFDEALGTLTRRRKYTLDNNTSRHSSNLTVNGDPAKIYDGNPQDTTTSIMGIDLTPKPPARRFGQVSPRLKDNIPPLDFEDRESKENGDVILRNKLEETPVPPLRRFGNRSSQKLNGITSDFEEDPANRSGDMNLKDENENVPEDYVFKRFSQDAVRRSNLSINSCTSVISTASTYGRKKRRAPQPPKRKEQLETPLEGDCQPAEPSEKSIIELQITESIDVARGAENIEDMTKKSNGESNESLSQKEKKQAELSIENALSSDARKNETCENSQSNISDIKEKKNSSSEEVTYNPDERLERIASEAKDNKKKESNKEQLNNADNSAEDFVNVEYERTSQEKIEIIKDADLEYDEVNLRTKGSALSRSDSFCVKEEIEKIERQIKALESKEAAKEMDDAYHDNSVTNTRLSIQANRRHFFENMVDGPIKLEFKQLPCEQTDIHVVRLTDQLLPAPRDPVKVIELHISEPIRHKPESLDEVNPIPKPRRHSALSLKDESEIRHLKDEGDSSENHDKKGKS